MKSTKRYALYEDRSISPIKMYITSMIIDRYHFSSDISKALKFNSLTKLIRYMNLKPFSESDTKIRLKVAIVKREEEWIFNQRIK